MNYEQTIDYLFTRLPMFSKSGAAAIKADLTNTIALCQLLDHPEEKFPAVHIAGTNGKGSTSHMLAAILQRAGFKTGLYTSPHLYDFRERIKVNGEMISREKVIHFVQKMKDPIEKIKPSFFEITVAMAFDHFASEKLDIAVIETGLGGRLDSTNIIQPVLSVITNISMDHADILGDTLEKIASEKAGIIKPDTPVIIGEKQNGISRIFEEKAGQLAAPLRFASEKLECVSVTPTGRKLLVRLKDVFSGFHFEYQLDLAGAYQRKNLITTLVAVEELQKLGWNIPESAISEALSEASRLTGLQGRWERLSERPAIIVDVAHNEAGIGQLADQLEYEDFERLHIIIGTVKDKDIAAMLAALPDYATYYFTNADIPRALPGAKLKETAEACCLYGDYYEDVNKAMDAARQTASDRDLILVYGSIFIAAQLDRSKFPMDQI